VHTTAATTRTTARAAADPRTGWAAVTAGALLFVSVAAELVRPVQRSDGSVVDLPGFLGYLSLWTVGAAALAVAVYRLPGRVGRGITLAGAVLLAAFGAVGMGTAVISGSPAEWTFLLFAIGLLLMVIGAVPFARGLRPTLPRWWTAVLVAGAGGAVGLLAEQDPWHDVGLFLCFGAWAVLGLRLLGPAADKA
jgi:hypothetical protein